ncbi:MAG TPA: phosphoribosylamine--glycine ligase [Thermomicrobiales bacterium]|nr:phosphoribosylamine--glycine ligase [Thermomicrobiales bacterium]
MGIRVLVVGGGGREHAVVWKLSQSARIDAVLCTPGNPGIAAIADCATVPVTDLDGIVELALTRQVDLVVVGPEDPLAAGLADKLTAAGIPVAGPSAAAARIEASKSFAKEVMAAAGVSTAQSRTVTTRADGLDAIRAIGGSGPVVVKADGLAAGKGVVVAATPQEAERALDAFLIDRTMGDAGASVVIEAFMEGQEVSVLSLTDGTTIHPLAPSCDYKRAFEDDAGPNTGGMGVYTPTRLMNADQLADVQRTILQPTIDEMARRGTPMRGILYAGLIMTPAGPQVLEFNARFGDPETQVVLPTMDGDLGALLEAVATGTLADVPPPTFSGAAVGVVLASGGYPASYPTGLPIAGLEDGADDRTLVFHAGTKRDDSGQTVTSGGRVLTVVGLGDDLAAARDCAYARAEHITFAGRHLRYDIAAREL